MLYRIIAAILLATSAFVLLLGCDDNSTDPDDLIPVSGRVFAYICHPDSTVNDTLDSLYTSNTGRQAEIHFASLTTPTFAPVITYTNAQSEYAIRLIEGIYTIIVLTDHSAPDVFDSVFIDRELTLDIRIRYDFADPDTFVVSFWDEWEAALQSPGQTSERDLIDSLNARIGNMLETGSMRVWSVIPTPGIINVLYAILRNTSYRMHQIVQAVRWAMNDPLFPETMSAGPRTYGLCPDDFEFDSTYRE